MHMFESIYFTMLMKPTYEKPVDSAQDIVELGLTVFYSPGDESIVEMMKNSPHAINRDLAKLTVVAKVIFFISKFDT